MLAYIHPGKGWLIYRHGVGWAVYFRMGVWRCLVKDKQNVPCAFLFLNVGRRGTGDQKKSYYVNDSRHVFTPVDRERLFRRLSRQTYPRARRKLLLRRLRPVYPCAGQRMQANAPENRGRLSLLQERRGGVPVVDENLYRIRAGGVWARDDRRGMFGVLERRDIRQLRANTRSRPPHGPTAAQWEQAVPVFSRLLSEYRPDRVIPWGDRLYNKLPPLDGREGEPVSRDDSARAVWVYPLGDGHCCEALSHNHPSSGYSWEYWHACLEQFIKR